MQPGSPVQQSASMALRGADLTEIPNPGRRWQAAVQGTLLALAAVVALAPPVDGAILIAPLLPGDSAASLGWARQAGAQLIAPGPYPRSYVVKGSLAALLGPALSHGTLLLPARVAGCGATRSKVL